MTRGEYNELFNQLCFGHEAEISYNDKQYFLEWEDLKLIIYDITDSEGIKIINITDADKITIVTKLFAEPFLENNSLNEVYKCTKIIDIE